MARQESTQVTISNIEQLCRSCPRNKKTVLIAVITGRRCRGRRMAFRRVAPNWRGEQRSLTQQKGKPIQFDWRLSSASVRANKEKLGISRSAKVTSAGLPVARRKVLLAAGDRFAAGQLLMHHAAFIAVGPRAADARLPGAGDQRRLFRRVGRFERRAIDASDSGVLPDAVATSDLKLAGAPVDGCMNRICLFFACLSCPLASTLGIREPGCAPASQPCVADIEPGPCARFRRRFSVARNDIQDFAPGRRPQAQIHSRSDSAALQFNRVID